MAKPRLYRVTFLNQGQVYEIYARAVSQGHLLGFVMVEGLVFGEKTRVVVDPNEERLQREFAGVKCCFLPLHSVVRIDEVERSGPAGGRGCRGREARPSARWAAPPAPPPRPVGARASR